MASERALRVIAQAVEALIRGECVEILSARKAAREILYEHRDIEHEIVYGILSGLARLLDERLDDEPSVDEDCDG